MLPKACLLSVHDAAGQAVAPCGNPIINSSTGSGGGTGLPEAKSITRAAPDLTDAVLHEHITAGNLRAGQPALFAGILSSPPGFSAMSESLYGKLGRGAKPEPAKMSARSTPNASGGWSRGMPCVADPQYARSR